MTTTHVIVFIVNGDPTPIEITPHMTLRAAADQALQKTNNGGRLVGEWELRHESGVLIPDPSSPVWDYGLPDDVRLYLTIRVGVGA